MRKAGSFGKEAIWYLLKFLTFLVFGQTSDILQYLSTKFSVCRCRKCVHKENSNLSQISRYPASKPSWWPQFWTSDLSVGQWYIISILFSKQDNLGIQAKCRKNPRKKEFVQCLVWYGQWQLWRNNGIAKTTSLSESPAWLYGGQGSKPCWKDKHP